MKRRDLPKLGPFDRAELSEADLTKQVYEMIEDAIECETLFENDVLAEDADQVRIEESILVSRPPGWSRSDELLRTPPESKARWHLTRRFGSRAEFGAEIVLCVFVFHPRALGFLSWSGQNFEEDSTIGMP